MGHVDGCPECVTTYNQPTWQERDPNGCRAFYECVTCHHTWATEWGHD